MWTVPRQQAFVPRRDRRRADGDAGGDETDRIIMAPTLVRDASREDSALDGG